VAEAALALVAVAARDFRHRREYPLEPWRVPAVVDLHRWFGQQSPTAEEIRRQYARGRGHTFVSMAEALLDDLADALPAPDLVIVAHDTPDLDLVQSSASFLAHRVPGSPNAFAICDQGAGAPFTALHLLSELAADSTVQAATLAVFDQATQPVPLPRNRVPLRDCGVLLAFGPRGPTVCDLVVEEPLAPEQAVDQVTAYAGDPRAAGLVVAGRALNQIAGTGLRQLGYDLRTTPPYLDCTGVWRWLARLVRKADRSWSTAWIGEYERRTGRLHLARIRHQLPPNLVLEHHRDPQKQDRRVRLRHG